MLFLGKLIDLGSAAPRVYVRYQNISDWLTADCLTAYKVPEKHHLGLRRHVLEGTVYTPHMPK